MRYEGLGGRLWRRLWIPLLLVATAEFTAGVGVLGTKPEYLASATVAVKSQIGLDRPLSFADMATSNTVLLKVKNDLGLDESLEALAGNIQVTSGRTDLYTVTVRDTDPTRATRIANAVASNAALLYVQVGSGVTSSSSKQLEQERAAYLQRYQDAAKALAGFRREHPETINPTLQDKVDSDIAARHMQLQLQEHAASDAYLQLESRVTQTQVDRLTNKSNFDATVVDQAFARPDNLGRLFKMLYAGGIALIVGLLLILLLEYRVRSVREVADVENLVGAPVIATIPRATRRTLRRRPA